MHHSGQLTFVKGLLAIASEAHASMRALLEAQQVPGLCIFLMLYSSPRTACIADMRT